MHKKKKKKKKKRPIALFDLTCASSSISRWLWHLVMPCWACRAADDADTDDDACVAATVHSTLMVTGRRRCHRARAPAGRADGRPDGDHRPSVIGYLILAAGAWVGGEVVYALGTCQSPRVALLGSKSEWTELDVSEIPENTPTAAKAGAQSLVLVRQGEQVFGLHAQRARAIRPSSGTVVDGCIECPSHGSRLRLSTGYKKRGPTTFDQPRYEVRAGRRRRLGSAPRDRRQQLQPASAQ